MRQFLDSHTHMMDGKASLGPFLEGLDKAGAREAIVISCPPESWGEPTEGPTAPAERLSLIMDWARRSERVHPLFWIDPTEEGAFEQVDAAVAAGVSGFKAICTHYFPADPRPMRVWERIARAGKPILFHSGILYGVRPSAQYNRPANFEALFGIPGLRFAMAHVSWPWCDECLAVYGYWNSRRHRGLTTAELFLDATPGTPPIYREETLTKLYTVGYDIEDNLMLGIDNRVDYRPEYALRIVSRDEEIFDKLGVDEAQREKYFRGNALRFLGR